MEKLNKWLDKHSVPFYGVIVAIQITMCVTDFDRSRIGAALGGYFLCTVFYELKLKWKSK